MRIRSGWLALGVVLPLLGGCAAGILTGSGREGPATHYPSDSDAALTNEINRRLIADPALDAFAIQVESVEGVVTLTGHVAEAAQAERAARIAGGVPGVKGLRNHLVIGKTLKK